MGLLWLPVLLVASGGFAWWLLSLSKFSVRGNIKRIIKIYRAQEESVLSSGISYSEIDKELKQDLLILTGSVFLGYSSLGGEEYTRRSSELKSAVRKQSVRSLRQLITYLLDEVHPIEVGEQRLWLIREGVIDRYYERCYKKVRDQRGES